MRIFPRGLGPKLNLSLLVFLLLLGAATASIVLLGFRRTQDNATKTSRDGLEAESRQTLGILALTQSEFGQSQLEATAGLGQQAARYMLDARASVAATSWDPARLAKDARGDAYDPDPKRGSSVYVPAAVPVDDKVLRDLRDSAVLDAIFPAVLAGYSGESRSANFDAVAVYFNSVNGVTRYFPAIPVDQFAPNTDPRNMVAAEGPAANPKRTTHWTTPYTDKTGRGEVITATIPVYDGDEYRGIIGLDVSLNQLSAQIDQLKPTPNSYAFYLDVRGELFHTASSDIVRAAIDSKNAGFASIIASMKAGETSVGRAQLDGQEVFVAYAPVGGVGGSLAIVAPLADVTQQASLVADGIDHQGNRTVVFVLTTMVIFFGAALAAAAWMNRRNILRPIEEIVAGTRAVAGGDLSARIPVRSADELAMLADAFNIMTGEVQEARELLEERVDERTRELSALLSVSQSVASKIELGPLLAALVEQLSNVVEYNAISVLMRDGDELVLLDVSSNIGGSVTNPFTGARFPARGAIWEAMERGEAIAIADVRDPNDTWARRYLRVMGEQPGGLEWAGAVTSWLCVPLVAQDRVVGSLAVASGTAGYFTDERIRLVRGIASQAAVAVVNARLFEETQLRTRELTTLLDVAHNVASTLELDPLLHVVLQQVGYVAPNDRAALLIREGDGLRVAAAMASPGQPEAIARVGMTFPLSVVPLIWTCLVQGESAIIDDVRADTPMAVEYRGILGPLAERALSLIRSWMAAPLMFEGRVVGVVILSAGEPGFFTQHHAQLTTAIGAHAGVAIENARLFAETEERTRELTTLLEVSRNVASTLDVETLLAHILEHVHSAVGYDVCALMLMEHGKLTVRAARGIAPEIDRIARSQIGLAFPARQGLPLWDVMSGGEHAIIDDLRADTPLTQAFFGATRDVGNLFPQIVNWMAAPVMVKDRIVGVLSMSCATPGYYTPRHAQLAKAIASQAGVAVENARLFEETQQSARELGALLDVSHTVASRLDRDGLSNLVLDQLKRIIDYTGSSVVFRDGDMLEILASRSATGALSNGMRIPIAGAMGLWDRILALKPVIIEDVRADTPLAASYRDAIGAAMDTPGFNDIRSWMAVPLAPTDVALGFLTMSRTEPGYFTERHADLARAVADQAAVALENARLFEETQQSARELGALLDISHTVASTLDKNELVSLVLDQLKRIVDYTGASVSLFTEGALTILESRTPRGDIKGVRVPIGQPAILWDRILDLQPVLIDDINNGEDPLAVAYLETIGDLISTPGFSHVRSWMAIPLAPKDQAIGIVTVSHSEPGYFTRRHADLARAVADQAAVALENARLFEDSQQRTRELSMLLGVAQSVASTIELEPLMDVLAQHLRTVIDCFSVTVLTREGDEVNLLDISNPGDQPEDPPTAHRGDRVPAAGAIWRAMERGETVAVADVRDEDDPWARRYRRAIGTALDDPRFAPVRAWLAVPLETPDRVGGMLHVSSREVGYFTPPRQALVRGIANQAAVAIENARLFEETQQSARELGALLDVTQAIASTLDVRKASGLILDHLKGVVDYTNGSLSIIEDGALGILENRGPLPSNWLNQMRVEALRRGDLPSAADESAETRGLLDMLSGEVVVINDIWDESDTSVAFRQGAEASAARAGVSLDPVRALHSYVRVPVMAQQRLAGLLILHHELPYFYTPQRVRLVRAVADQAAVAIENAHLFEETQRRGRETEALFRADEQLFQSLSLDAVFQALVDVCVDVLGMPKSMVTTIDDSAGHYTIRASRNISQQSLDTMAAIRASQPRTVLAEITETIVNADARDAMPEMLPVFDAEGIYTTVDVPIKSTGTLRGVLGAAYTSRRVLTQDELRLLQALAERAAVAIDNAELYERAQQVASLEERQKLARELHDSVSQALYGIALGARTARTLLDRDPAKAIEPVDYVLSLAEAGLTEMRALIFELRPESLETEGLVVAIEKNVAATQARYGLDVAADLCAEPAAPLDVKEAAYRIAQEALHNIVKHAHATRVDVRLTHVDSTLTLEISDNGVGFDAGGAFPGHIGLRSMRERTSKGGGTIEIASAPGAGTRIVARLRV